MSLAWTVDFDKAMVPWGKAYPYVITIVFLGPLLCTRVEDYVRALKALIITGGAICFAVLFFGHWGNRGLTFQGGIRTLETNPLAIASVAGQVLVTVLLVPLSRNKLIRWLAVLVISPICVAVVMRSGSRGQLLGALERNCDRVAAGEWTCTVVASGCGPRCRGHLRTHRVLQPRFHRRKRWSLADGSGHA